jgi:hypothetical protein
MGAPTPAAPHPHAGLRFRYRLQATAAPLMEGVLLCARSSRREIEKPATEVT